MCIIIHKSASRETIHFRTIHFLNSIERNEMIFYYTDVQILRGYLYACHMYNTCMTSQSIVYYLLIVLHVGLNVNIVKIYFLSHFKIYQHGINIFIYY